MRSVSRSGTHHIVFQLNFRSYANAAANCYSLLKLLTGFAKAAFIAWKLMVIKVITMAINADKINTDGPMVIR